MHRFAWATHAGDTKALAKLKTSCQSKYPNDTEVAAASFTVPVPPTTQPGSITLDAGEAKRGRR